MGKTPRPLVIYVAPEVLGRDEMIALQEKGHDVRPLALDPSPDLIMHEAAHAWPPEMWEKATYLEAALKRARARRKEAK